MSDESLDICDVGSGGGLMLPLGGDWEQAWPRELRIVLYLAGLLWFFLGVAIVSDVFMGAIECITSKKRRRKHPKTGRYITTMVWNATVANLTLMALGSSAPEILLSVIELLSNDWYSGDLGPSTIVGSAAFNLLCITAVCVVSIPDGEVRRIKDTNVYAVTAGFSLFAYIWLWFILTVTSKNVVDLWEGILTFLFFPLLVIIAFIADKGYFSAPTRSHGAGVLDSNTMPEELARMELDIRKQHGEHLTDNQVVRFIEYEHQAPRSRAAYRVKATREMTGGRRVNAPKNPALDDPLYNVVPTCTAGDDRCDMKKQAIVEFVSAQHTVLESVGSAKILVARSGDMSSLIDVRYATRDGTATAGSDYTAVDGRLTFKAGQTEATIEVKIVDDTSFENDEKFFVDLSSPEANSGIAELGPNVSTTVVIIDDDDPGQLGFANEQVSVTEDNNKCQDMVVQVLRSQGGSGVIGCSYYTEDDTAIAGADYDGVKGDLKFEVGQMHASIKLNIKARGRYETTEMFRLILTAPTGGARFDETTDGGQDSCICSITIESDAQAKERIDRLMGVLRVNWDKASTGHNNWKDQFTDAIFVNGADGEGASVADLCIHLVTLPWKLFVALVPPTDFCDGWLCFFCALAVIGGVTAVIGDMANLLGCVMGLPSEICAITFVALGTSLPDTFASKAAAQQDPYADASIGNVTGSNSVNVFLGLGLPWMVGSMYWTINGPDDEWNRKYANEDWAKDFLDGAFMVPAESLGLSVIVFSCCSICCFLVLGLRRRFVNGELGGPTGVKYATAALLVFLWGVFIVAFSVQVLNS